MSRQAFVIDIHLFYRTKGIDWGWVSENLDAIGIRGSQGMRMDELLPEHVELANSHNVEYFTYSQLTHAAPYDEAVDFYLELEGVAGHPVALGVEPADQGMVTEYYARKAFERADQRSGFEAWYYSNYNSSKKIGFPQWSKNRFVWWAEYPYDIFTKYRSHERYMLKNPWKIPKWAVRAGYNPSLHQYSDYGDAQATLANAQTGDPYYRQGIKSADFNASLIDVAEFKKLFKPVVPGLTIGERVSRLEDRVDCLEKFH